MAKVVVIYDSRYGNTKQVGEAIAEGMKGVPGAETALSSLKQAGPARLADYDAILIGSPNHFGTATWSTRRFINRLGRPDLEGKLVAFFDTYLGGDANKAVRKMEGRARKKAPRLEVVSPGLSVEVAKIKGPIVEGELPKCREFAVRIAARLKERA